jgi:hypothetical protein
MNVDIARLTTEKQEVKRIAAILQKRPAFLALQA